MNKLAEKIACINGSVLKWARVQCGDLQLKSIEELLPKIEAWERGEDYPTYAQLEKLAEAYRKPIAVFFFPNPPEGVSYKAEFRTTSDSELSVLPHKVTRLINEALVMQINLQELTQKPKPKEMVLHNRVKDISDDKLGIAIREILKIDINRQIKTKNSKEMLEIWRDAFYEQGVYVFKEAFSTKNISGFCIYDEQFPIIYLNNSMSFTRQTFTLFHELYHLIHETGGIDRIQDDLDDSLSKDQQHIERMCNHFAASFLLPKNELNQAVTDDQLITYEYVSMLADKFCVSKETLILRLIELGKIDWTFYNEHIKEIHNDFIRNRVTKGRGNSNYNLISYLGRRYLNLVFSAYREQRIDAFQLASYTKTKVSNLPALERAWGWKV